MASGRLPLPPFLLVKPAFGSATFVTVPLLSVSKCLRMGGRDFAMRIFFNSSNNFTSVLKCFFLSLVDHHLLNVQIYFSKEN